LWGGKTLNKGAEMSFADAVDQTCLERSVGLAPVRRHVVAILSQATRCSGADEILTELEGRDRRRPGQPSFYGALDFLLEHRLVQALPRH
jgi:Fe2+ or Zn2+ uptake regulation protein